MRCFIVWDFENTHRSLRKQNTNIFEQRVIEKLYEFIIKNDLDLLSFTVYANFDENDLHESFTQSKLQEYGIETRHIRNNGKNSCDSKIISHINDLLNYKYKELADIAIIISSDKDMITPIQDIKSHGKEAWLITTKSDFDYSVMTFPDRHFFIEDIIEEYEAKEQINHKEELYANLCYHIKCKINDEKKCPKYDYNITMNSNMKWLCIPKYEVYRLLLELEREGRIRVFQYNYNTMVYYSIVPSDYYNYYNEYIPENDYINNFFSEKGLLEIYENYNPKEF